MRDETTKKIAAEQARLIDALNLPDVGLKMHEMESITRGIRESIAHSDGMASISHSLTEAFIRNEELIRAAIGPFEDIKKSGILSLRSPLAEELREVHHLLANYEARFHLPDISESATYLTQFASMGITDSLRRYAEEASSVQKAMAAMHSPWLDTQETFRSVTAFAELQGIGHALATMPPFGKHLTEALRVDLGDWRDRIVWPEPIFTDIMARADFYVGQGFDPGLTSFPASAFEESIEIAGLRPILSPLVDRYGKPIPPSEDKDEEEGLTRTNVAHDWLQRLENRLRRFIDSAMTAAFGEDWPKRRLPNGLYEQWQAKKQAAEQAGGREWSLIDYADFTDYELIICRRDNWREVFASVFSRQESVRESFQRLYPIRICTMHARSITQDDELFLYVELRRLMRAIQGE